MRSLRHIGRADTFRAVLGFTFAHWRDQPWLAAGIAVAVLVGTIADVLMPVFAGQLVDAIALGGDREAARRSAFVAFFAILALGAVGAVLSHLYLAGIVRFTLRMMTRVVHEAFHRVQRFSTEWHASSFAGSTVRKISRGMWALDLLNDTLLAALLPSLVVLVGSSVVLAFYWPVMGLIVFLGATAYVALTGALSLLYVAPAARLSNFWDTRMGGALADAIGCNNVVKAFGAEAREDARLVGVTGKWQKRTGRSWGRMVNTNTAQHIGLVGLRALIVGAVLWLWWRGQATPGDVTYVITTYFVIHGYLRDVGHHIRNLQRSINDMEELVDFYAEPIGVEDRPGARPARIEAGEVVFDCVTFHYKGHATPLYSDFSVRIAPGEKVGLVGRSGSGKTTFVKLIQRLYDVNEGRIMIDGEDVAEATQASLRAEIAIVQQEPILFHRSLAENIAYARPRASMAEVMHAAELANAHDFISSLPNGYGTLVGERGVKLSGGERQRVALARAFLADAPILILDEATSSLDSESELLIQQAIERLMKGRTAIVIAHRLSTVRAMDRILVFDRGRIVEEGDHIALVSRERGIYKSLFEKQALELSRGLRVA